MIIKNFRHRRFTMRKIAKHDNCTKSVKMLFLNPYEYPRCALRRRRG